MSRHQRPHSQRSWAHILSAGLLLSLCGSSSVQAIELCDTRSQTPCAVSTFHSLSVYWSPEGGRATRQVEVLYRVEGESIWEQALPLEYNPIDQDTPIRRLVKGDYRGSIVELSADKRYEIKLTLQGTSTTHTFTAQTWPERFPTDEQGTTRVTQTGLKTYKIDRSGTSERYRVFDGMRPDGTRTVIDSNKQSPYNVVIDASYVILRNFELRGAKSDAIFLEDDIHHVVIESNDISDWGSLSSMRWQEGGKQKSYTSKSIGENHQAAIRAKGSQQRVKVSQIVIQNNVIHDPTYGSNHWGQCSLGVAFSDYKNAGKPRPDCHCTNTNDFERAQERCEQSGDTQRYNHPGGPQVFDLTQSDGNHVVRYNTIYSRDEKRYFNDIFGGSSTNTDARGYPGADSDFYGNYVANCYDNGFEMEGGGQNVRVWGNFVDMCYEPIANAPVWIGPLYVFRNVTWRSFRTPLGFKNGTPSAGRFIKAGYAGKLPAALERMRGYTYVFHNTLDNTNNMGASGIGDGRYAHHVKVQNNVLWVRNGSQALTINTSRTRDLSYTYNLSNGRIPDAFKGDASHNLYATSFTPEFARRRVSRTPDAAYARTAWDEPIVVDYVLKSDSIGHDAAGLLTAAELSSGPPRNIIPNFSHRYEGKAPDIGAQERDAALMIVGPRDLTRPPDVGPGEMCIPRTCRDL